MPPHNLRSCRLCGLLYKWKWLVLGLSMCGPVVLLLCLGHHCISEIPVERPQTALSKTPLIHTLSTCLFVCKSCRYLSDKSGKGKMVS